MNTLELNDPLCITEELRMLREQVRRFVTEEVIPVADAWEREGRVPRAIFRRLGGLGLLGMRHPVEHGGTDMGPVASVLWAEELGRSGYGGVPASVLVHTDMSSTHISRRGTDKQKHKYLPGIIQGEKIVAIAVTEAGAGSDVAGMKTRATRDGDHWVINGSKLYITNGVHGDLYIVAARTDPQAKGSRGISLFIVEKGTPGLVVARELDKHGDLCSDTAELYFDNLRVPAENMLGEENKGFYAVMDNFQNERLVMAGNSIGSSLRAIEITLDHVRTRQAFGGTLWDLQATRQKLSMLATKVTAARALTYSAAELEAQGRDCVREISMAKIFACEVNVEVVNSCLQLHGGSGFMRGMAIERMTRDARIQTIGGGATEVMLEEVGKRL
ncbi:acyl-CoA dehydrogenase family protein [Hydrogenophaga sp.]|uniref:acyl-CoA dehydrogenase family protein n=1 Tax=Hydrogenophaga sp. TaxID=1904254 RepID=UPI0035634DEE